MPAELRRTPLNGVFELHAQPFADHRGAFLNAFRAQDPAFMGSWGDRGIAQVNLSRTEAVGTIRGLHLQAEPHSEAKLVRCLRGRVWDLAVDLRKDSIDLRPVACSGAEPRFGPRAADPGRLRPWFSGAGAWH